MVSQRNPCLRRFHIQVYRLVHTVGSREPWSIAKKPDSDHFGRLRQLVAPAARGSTERCLRTAAIGRIAPDREPITISGRPLWRIRCRSHARRIFLELTVFVDSIPGFVPECSTAMTGSVRDPNEYAGECLARLRRGRSTRRCRFCADVARTCVWLNAVNDRIDSISGGHATPTILPHVPPVRACRSVHHVQSQPPRSA